jgi:hypothetical protein
MAAKDCLYALQALFTFLVTRSVHFRLFSPLLLSKYEVALEHRLNCSHVSLFQGNTGPVPYLLLIELKVTQRRGAGFKI